jgi:hypothetical protein
MRSHAEKLALAREETEHKKKQRKLPAAAAAETGWRPVLR